MTSPRTKAQDHSNVTPLYKPNNSGAAMSAKPHQKDLAEMSGNTDARKAFAKTKNADKAGLAYGAAVTRARKSFGIKPQG